MAVARYTPVERRLMARLDTPAKVQAWLRRLPYNWERKGETARSFRSVVRHGEAHCLEAALAAAAILETHGHPPLILDIESTDLLDHVLFVYRDGRGKWGSVARSRCVGLHGRKPVFSHLTDLVRSYRAPFIDTTGRVKGYGVLDLRTLRVPWRTSPRNVWAVEDALNANRHARLQTPERFYRTWKRRYDAWWTANGRPAHDWPDFPDFPDRDTWS